MVRLTKGNRFCNGNNYESTNESSLGTSRMISSIEGTDSNIALGESSLGLSSSDSNNGSEENEMISGDVGIGTAFTF